MHQHVAIKRAGRAQRLSTDAAGMVCPSSVSVMLANVHSQVMLGSANLFTQRTDIGRLVIFCFLISPANPIGCKRFRWRFDAWSCCSAIFSYLSQIHDGCHYDVSERQIYNFRAVQGLFAAVKLLMLSSLFSSFSFLNTVLWSSVFLLLSCCNITDLVPSRSRAFSSEAPVNTLILWICSWLLRCWCSLWAEKSRHVRVSTDSRASRKLPVFRHGLHQMLFSPCSMYCF